MSSWLSNLHAKSCSGHRDGEEFYYTIGMRRIDHKEGGQEGPFFVRKLIRTLIIGDQKMDGRAHFSIRENACSASRLRLLHDKRTTI